MAEFIKEDPWCLCLPEELADARDFKAEDTIDLDWDKPLPKSFSLGKRIRKTNYQWAYGSCTANATTHGVQILNVMEKWIIPTDSNIITPDWKDLRINMWHNINDINDSWDYVDKAVNTSRKMWIKNEEWGVSKYDGYAYGQRGLTNLAIETIKRYIYNENPIVWCMRWNKITWNELTKGQLRTYIKPEERTGGHAIACVGWDEWWLRFVNSRKTNDWKGFKSRFYVTYADMIKCGSMFNWRYWALFMKDQAKKDPEYLQRKANAWEAIKALKKVYTEETTQVQRMIESLSIILRKHYPELNDEIPLNS